MAPGVDEEISAQIFVREGEVDPVLNKTVSDLIFQTNEICVYLDTDCSVQWRGRAISNAPKAARSIVNRVSHLETISMSLMGTKFLRPFRRLLAEGIARMYGDDDLKAATEVLDKAERYLGEKKTELGRIWYLQSSFSVVLIVALLALAAFVARGSFTQPTSTVLTYGIYISFGSIGAFLSVLLRQGSMVLDASAGRSIHYYEGVARVLVGVIGGLVAVAAIQSNVAFGVLKEVATSGHTPWLFILICLVSGASERLVPSFIAAWEKPHTSADKLPP